MLETFYLELETIDIKAMTNVYEWCLSELFTKPNSDFKFPFWSADFSLFPKPFQLIFCMASISAVKLYAKENEFCAVPKLFSSFFYIYERIVRKINK